MAEIAARGDAAVREMSVKFDKWDRADYRLSQAEIDAPIAVRSIRAPRKVASDRTRSAPILIPVPAQARCRWRDGDD